MQQVYKELITIKIVLHVYSAWLTGWRNEFIFTIFHIIILLLLLLPAQIAINRINNEKKSLKKSHAL
jgi:hypothetical protein